MIKQFKKMSPSQFVVFFIGVSIALWGTLKVFKKVDFEIKKKNILASREKQNASDEVILNDVNTGSEQKTKILIRLARKKNLLALQKAKIWVDSSNLQLALASAAALVHSTEASDFEKVVQIYKKEKLENRLDLISELGKSADPVSKIEYFLRDLKISKTESIHLKKYLYLYKNNPDEKKEIYEELLGGINSKNSDEKENSFYAIMFLQPTDLILNEALMLEIQSNKMNNNFIKNAIWHMANFKPGILINNYQDLINKGTTYSNLQLIATTSKTCPPFIKDLLEEVFLNNTNIEVQSLAADLLSQHDMYYATKLFERLKKGQTKSSVKSIVRNIEPELVNISKRPAICQQIKNK